MAARNDWLTDSLQLYLDRRSMPQGLKDKPRAQISEAQALVKAIIRLAPTQGYQDWWDDFLEVLAGDAKTRAWPTEGEIAAAAKSLRRPSSTGIANPEDFDAFQAHADKINAGEAVGDLWIYGPSAVKLIAEYGITEGQLRAYRSGLYFNFKATYGADGARRMEAEYIAKHEAAVKDYRQGEAA